MISIEIAGKPVSWKPPRVTSRGTYSLHTKKKKDIQWDLKSKYAGLVLEGPIRLVCHFYFLPPKSTSDTIAEKMLNNEIYFIKKPDLSNLVKFIEDCCTGILWKDDNQIVCVTAEKHYGKTENTILYVEEMQWGEL